MDTAGAALIGAQRPRLWTAPDRHRELTEGCPSCGDPEYKGAGCGDYLSTDVLAWAQGFGYELDDWQQWVLTEGLGTKPDGRWASFENAVILSRQNGKGPESLSNEVCTRRGWVTFADIQPGDEVLGSDGRFTAVVAVSPVYQDEPCYAVTFTDGARVVVGHDHLWHVRHKARKHWQDLRTDELAESVGGKRPDNGRMEYNWRVRCDTVPDFPEADLPVDPYLLGYWLGDGTTGQATLTVGWEDRDWVCARLYRAGCVKSGWEGADEPPVPKSRQGGSAFTVGLRLRGARMRDGLESRLRKLGIWGSKRIPEAYLTASVAQRKALLAGLMDSDGSITRNNRTPQCEFSASFPALADGVHRLLRSLGVRVTPVTRVPVCNGKPGALSTRFLWTPSFCPFEMPRKAARWQPPVSRRHELMSIIAIEPMPSVPVRCITVASPDGIYLTGRLFTPTHNCILEIRELAGLFVIGESLIIHTSHEFKTSQEHFRRVRATVENYDALRRRLKGKPIMSHGDEAIELLPVPTLIFGSGSRRIRRKVGSRLRFLARSRGSGRGFTSDLLVYDEAMILSAEQIGASLPTMAAVPNPQVWYMGSAGMPDSDQLGAVRRRIVRNSKTLYGAEWSARLHTPACPRDERRGRAANDYVVDCTEHDDRDDPRTWARVNPAYGIRLREEFIANELDSMPPVEFNRERLGVGQWPSEAEAWGVISEDAWSALAIADAGGTTPPIAFAVDASEDGEATIGAAWAHRDGKIVIEVPRGCSRPGTSWLVPRLKELVREWKPAVVVVPKNGPAAGLGDDIEAAFPGRVLRPGSADEAAAFAWFTQQVKAPGHPLAHFGKVKAGRLWKAVGSAETRVVGDGGKTWRRRDSDTDITPVTTVTLASWGLNKNRRGYDPLKSIG